MHVLKIKAHNKYIHMRDSDLIRRFSVCLPVNLLTHIVFILWTEGVVKLPLDVLKEYMQHTGKSHDADSVVRHYHVLIKNDPKLILWVNQETRVWDLEEHFYVFET